MLRNRSTSLKLEKKYLLLLILQLCARRVDDDNVGKMPPPLGAFQNSAFGSAVHLRWQASRRKTHWEEGAAVCLVSGASLPKNFAIAQSVHFWKHRKTLINEIANVGILQACQIGQCQCREDARMCVGVEGRQGRGAGRERGSHKSVQTHHQSGVMAMTTQTLSAYLHAQ